MKNLSGNMNFCFRMKNFNNTEFSLRSLRIPLRISALQKQYRKERKGSAKVSKHSAD
jgi:hypothetical protein